MKVKKPKFTCRGKAYIYHVHMKTITINVSEPVYVDFQRFAKESDRTTSELIREAMDQYRDKKIHGRGSLIRSEPAHVGNILRPWKGREDLLEGFFDARD
jgi:predicted CopG family antitoxin